MAVLHQFLAQATHVAARAVIEHHIRQEPAPGPTAASPSPSAPSATSSTSSSSISTSSSPSPTGTPPPKENDDGGGGNGTSPLLFFVALGFGVVFTNLWIIVGVKYCFRYNARNRALRMNEDGEPVPLENMPRPHRRRREKKLMTMDEVNEKFPMMKYKSWVLQRMSEGLPTSGGIDMSRANSVRSVEGVVPAKERESVDRQSERTATATAGNDSSEPANETSKPTAAEASPQDVSKESPEKKSSEAASKATPAAAEGQASGVVPDRATSLDHSHQDMTDDEDDEHINAALPTECIGTSGDTCAICIDTLEDDDDVRGLTCGHAFHARPQATDANGNPIDTTLSRSGTRGNMPAAPPPAWYNLRGQGVRLFASSTNASNQADARPGAPGRQRPTRQATQPAQNRPVQPARNSAPQTAEAGNRSIFSRLRLPQPFGSRGNRGGEQGPMASGANDPTPSQLEARGVN
ncbi:uncharacterized protein DNG_05024 [Cephalotrichum gorgonifer]|uniref:RING-type domain-containing protein n=1 Tax=Cephalotrichum gorgonifer TaxID=2041049 RepID=A0AAE8MX79_9PEZI|nr:uncharacterized protein DNG_05024 [Cephalotrichum gorgonifer]